MAYNSWRSSMWIWNAKWNEGKHIVTVLLKNHQASPHIFPFSSLSYFFYNFIVGCWLLRLNGQLNKITLGILETAVVVFFIYDFSPPHIHILTFYSTCGCWMATKESVFFFFSTTLDECNHKPLYMQAGNLFLIRK